MLYPLKFFPIFKEKIWGGNKIKTILNKDFLSLPNCGESWEISGIANNANKVMNGFLKNNTLDELVSVYMGDLVGEKIFDIYGEHFPLLIKFIDANSDLSVQVHPNDKLANQLYGENGKTEMWYVIDADEDAKINLGFNCPMTQEKLEEHVKKGTLENVLHYVDTKVGDVFYLPAGKVHAIGKGVLLAEIQQTSDITYRLYDYNRKDKDGNLRPLHIEEAYKAIDYQDDQNEPIRISPEKNKTTKLVHSPYFITNILLFNKTIEKTYIALDTFVIYICIEGKAYIRYDGGEETISKGECVLMPAIIEDAVFVPDKNCRLLETYLP